MKLATVADLNLRKADEDARTRIYGSAPINPFTVLRELNTYTYAELSRISHIDPMALKRAEWGTYTQPLPSLVDFWVKRSEVNHLDLLTDYEDFVMKQRVRHHLYFGGDLEFDLAGIHPFRQFRARRPSKATNTPLPVGLVECAKALCVPLDTIQFFEKKLSQKSVPLPIRVALNHCGYTQGQITSFDWAYGEWRERQLGRVVFS